MQTDRVLLPGTRRVIRWSKSRKAWFYEDNDERVPRDLLPREPAATQSSATSRRPSKLRRGSGAVDAALATGVGRLRLQDQHTVIESTVDESSSSDEEDDDDDSDDATVEQARPEARQTAPIAGGYSAQSGSRQYIVSDSQRRPQAAARTDAEQPRLQSNQTASTAASEVPESGFRQYTASDSQTGVRTPWQVGATRTDAETGRQYTLKAVQGAGKGRDDGQDPNKGDRSGKDGGRRGQGAGKGRDDGQGPNKGDRSGKDGGRGGAHTLNLSYSVADPSQETNQATLLYPITSLGR
ncbi:hypothetical protein LTR27_008721 [Elasticomyces elasticus]|nr:hypothetical protein LTR27_008721 [Elasticomyces elasticus]